MSDLRDRMIPLRAAVDAATEAAIGAMTRDLAPTQRGAPLTSLARSCSEGGKRFRGILAHVGHCLARGGPLDEAPVAPLSAALELYPASAPAHDDIIDHARTRRGRPTPHVSLAALHRDRAWRGDPDRFGEAGAILVGDLLFSWAEAAMADQAGRLAPRDAARLWARYSRMHAEVALGQFLDVAAEQAPLDPGDPGAMDTEAAMEVVVRKSARYSIVHPAALGAICGGADDALIAAIESILTPWGMAFQLRDDHLGVFGDPELTGKPSGDDIREGKRTVLLALRHPVPGAGPGGRARRPHRRGAPGDRRPRRRRPRGAHHQPGRSGARAPARSAGLRAGPRGPGRPVRHHHAARGVALSCTT